MKHYFGATPDGRLFWTFVITGGYDNTTCDLEADDPQCPHAQHLLSVYNKNMSANETLDKIVVFNCPCPPGGEAVCECPTNKRLSAYVDNGVLTDKPACNLLVDGVTITDETTVSRYPNSLFTVQLVGDPADYPDGSTATLFSKSMIENESIELTFTGGATNTATLRAPGQGTRNYLSLIGKLVCAKSLYVKGFAPTPG